MNHTKLRPKVGLALGGGAGLGWAHIGAIRVLQENNIPIDMVTGCSIGAIVGACVAADKLDHLEEVARNITLKDMLLWADPSFKKGSVLGARRVRAILKDNLGDLMIEDLPTPFACVASDLHTGAPVILNAGSLIDAVMASASVPGLFPPVEHNATRLVDGGMSEPVPVRTLRTLNPDVVIAVDLMGHYQGRSEKIGLNIAEKFSYGATLTIARASVLMILSNLSLENLKNNPCDVLIRPDTSGFEVSDFRKATTLIKRGRNAAEAALPSIFKALNEERVRDS